MAGAERAADLQRELRHICVGDGLDHLRAVLDDPRSLRLDADEIAGRVLQEDNPQAGLTAQLDELARLGGAGGVDRAVVADQPDRASLDRRMPANGGLAVRGLEIEKI